MDVSVLVATKAGSIMGPIASVFGYIMDFLFRITSSMGIMNIGLCIILFTIITKLLLFPLTIKQQESSKLMSLMNPEIKAVQNRYKPIRHRWLNNRSRCRQSMRNMARIRWQDVCRWRFSFRLSSLCTGLSTTFRHTYRQYVSFLTT